MQLIVNQYRYIDLVCTNAICHTRLINFKLFFVTAKVYNVVNFNKLICKLKLFINMKIYSQFDIYCMN